MKLYKDNAAFIKECKEDLALAEERLAYAINQWASPKAIKALKSEVESLTVIIKANQ